MTRDMPRATWPAFLTKTRPRAASTLIGARTQKRTASPPLVIGHSPLLIHRSIWPMDQQRRVSDDQRWRSSPLLGPGTDQRARCPGSCLRQEGRPRRPGHVPGHDQPRCLLRRPERRLPGDRADLRLHGRGHDAVPLRADAGRRRLIGLPGRDHQGPEGRRTSACGGPGGRAHRGRRLGDFRRPRRSPAGQCGRQHHRDANLIFGKYVWTFEVTSALLITAALGAMVLAHRERLTPRPTQRQWSERRFRLGKNLAGLPAPGVYARRNAVDTPALLPDGTPSEASVSRVLTAREQVTDPETFAGAERAIARDIEEGTNR